MMRARMMRMMTITMMMTLRMLIDALGLIV